QETHRHRVARLLANARAAVERGGQLTGHMLAFARRREAVLQPMDVSAAIRAMDPCCAARRARSWWLRYVWKCRGTPPTTGGGFDACEFRKHCARRHEMGLGTEDALGCRFDPVTLSGWRPVQARPLRHARELPAERVCPTALARR